MNKEIMFFILICILNVVGCYLALTILYGGIANNETKSICDSIGFRVAGNSIQQLNSCNSNNNPSYTVLVSNIQNYKDCLKNKPDWAVNSYYYMLHETCHYDNNLSYKEVNYLEKEYYLINGYLGKEIN